jgi:hypothetical protein
MEANLFCKLTKNLRKIIMEVVKIKKMLLLALSITKLKSYLPLTSTKAWKELSSNLKWMLSRRKKIKNPMK